MQENADSCTLMLNLHKTWNDSRHLGHRYPKNAHVYAPVVSGVTGVKGGPSEVVEGPCHGSP